MEFCFLVLDPDDLLPSSRPVYICEEIEEALEHAAYRKGYIVSRDADGVQSVVWVSPRFNADLMADTVENSGNNRHAVLLERRRNEITRLLRKHRMSETA